VGGEKICSGKVLPKNLGYWDTCKKCEGNQGTSVLVGGRRKGARAVSFGVQITTGGGGGTRDEKRLKGIHRPRGVGGAKGKRFRCKV